LYDILDITTGRKPRFVHNFMEGAGTNQQALSNYVKAVREVSYPGPQHEF
jgi:3-methyl-2-oxobutanoate hydroxymethyltransferase